MYRDIRKQLQDVTNFQYKPYIWTNDYENIYNHWWFAFVASQFYYPYSAYIESLPTLHVTVQCVLVWDKGLPEDVSMICCSKWFYSVFI